MSPPPLPRVLLIGPMYHPDGETLLAQHVDVQALSSPTPADIQRAIQTAAAAFVRYPLRLPGEALRAAPHLRVVSTSGRGTDAIDVAVATALGIAVVNNPGLGSVPVSEHTLALMLDLAKQTHRFNPLTHQGAGWTRQAQYARLELHGRTLGIIGLGHIGSEVARKCIAAFGMRVLAYDPYIAPPQAERVGATWVKHLDTLLAEADFVSIHAELTDETRGMINEPQLRQMRPHAFLLNTARGPIVHEAALAQALREGWIAGAGLDTFEIEPLPEHSPLRGLDNLIMTPHIAGLTVEAMRDLALSAANQILQVLRGERPPYLVNPAVWEGLQHGQRRGNRYDP
jgi:D-3-phosphoglycerate dehydrogenase